MKKGKRLLAIGLSTLLAFSITGCAVPYTYISVAGKYVEKHKSEFSEYFDTFEERFEEFFPDKYKGTYLEEIVKEKLGIGSGSSAEVKTEEETVKPEGSQDKKDTSDKKEESKPEKPKKEETASSSKEDEKTNSASSESSIQESEQESTEDSSASGTNTQSTSENSEGTASSALKSDYIPAYVHYEQSDFEKLCEDFKAAGQNNDKDEIERLYDALQNDLKLISTMSTVAFINFAIDVNNDYYDEEYAYCERIYTDCYDLFMLSCQEVLGSKGSDAFKNTASESVVEEAEDYKALTDKARELLDRETQLENEFNQSMDKLDKVSYELNGKTYTFDQLYEDDSALSMLALFHYDDFLKIYEGLLKAGNDLLGPIYVDLLQLRGQLADELGYDTYADYCYKEVYGREYTTKEAEEYCEIVKQNVGPKYYSSAYYKLYNSSYFETEFTTDEVLKQMDKFTAAFGSFLNDPFKEFKEKQLYDIGSGEGRYNGSFTTSVYTEGFPFIFANIDEDLTGLSTLVHEFGHFINDLYEEKDPDYFFCNVNYDVLEIHSTALELICSNHYPEIVPESEAIDAQDYELAAQLNSVVEGCIYDEFQRKAYENTDMTLDELNELFGDICSEYGQTRIPGFEYMWVLINHNFESPMYYISYSISALSALEIWTISLKDEKKAIDIWTKVVKEKDDEAYETVMKDAGLTPFTDSKGAVKICTYVMDYINGNREEAGGIAA